MAPAWHQNFLPAQESLNWPQKVDVYTHPKDVWSLWGSQQFSWIVHPPTHT